MSNGFDGWKSECGVGGSSDLSLSLTGSRPRWPARFVSAQDRTMPKPAVRQNEHETQILGIPTISSRW